MKTLLPTTLGLLALTFTFAPRHASAQGANDTVRIEVRVQSETEKKEASKDPKKAHSGPTTQEKTLEIMISGKPKTPETRTGKWMIYGRDEKKGHAVSVVDSGDFKLELPATGQQKVESKKVSLTFTPDHTEAGSKGKAGKKIEGTGSKYAGYGVEVKDGDKVVGEMYDPAGIKAEANK